MMNDPVVVPPLPLTHRRAQFHQCFHLGLGILLTDSVVLDLHAPKSSVAFAIVVGPTKVACVIRILSGVELSGDVSMRFQIFDDFRRASSGVVASVLRNE